MARKGQVGRYVNDGGYQMVYMPTHLRAQTNGYAREHVLIAEKALGKPLPAKAVVHHYGEKTDNAKLVICEDNVYHQLLHQRTAALRATGNPNARKCSYCGEYDSQSDISIIKRAARPAGNGRTYHRACAAAYVRAQKEA